MYNGVYTIEQFAYAYDTLKKWVSMKLDNTSLGDKLISHNVNRVIIYGANEIGQMVYKDICESVEIVGFVDKSFEKYSNGVCGKKVSGLDWLKNIEKDCYILVTPEYYFCDILRDLQDIEVPLNQVISLAMVVG